MKTEIIGLGGRRIVSQVCKLNAGMVNVQIIGRDGVVLEAISMPASHAVAHADNVNDLAQQSLASSIIETINGASPTWAAVNAAAMDVCQ